MFPFNSWKAAIVHEDSRGSGEEGIQGLRIRKNPRTARHFHGPNASVVLKDKYLPLGKNLDGKKCIDSVLPAPPKKKTVVVLLFMVLGDDST